MTPRTTRERSIPVVRETHSGVVFLLGDRAYKLKTGEPRFPRLLDPRAARRGVPARDAADRRLTPDVYLGVATVTDPEGEPCESLVVMRRMPDDRRLSTLVTSGADVAPHLRRLARNIAAFPTARTGPRDCRGPDFG